jgi:hypothetical protein
MNTEPDETADDIERRMNDAIRKALNTPPQPKPTRKDKAPSAAASAQKRGEPDKAS